MKAFIFSVFVVCLIVSLVMDKVIYLEFVGDVAILYYISEIGSKLNK